ncbi:hypothetical protein ASF17_10725 [Frigoribacterium sp. Leaf263]|uniref:hypothetical protein n=1 Tax=Frigoribacterium sp. Leaf263 TaxID=1736313 RepID=UPI0006F5E460|nr:hypothetical protein [Frigoribacterium sp. Leaf263]KQO81619.1 hypothetical protein ASF17_10725 [Frigoribacterium sp. Leaf263]
MHQDGHDAARRAVHGTMMLTTVGLVLLVATVLWGRGPLGVATETSPSDRATIDVPASPAPTATTDPSSGTSIVDVSLSSSADVGSMMGYMRSESFALIAG